MGSVSPPPDLPSYDQAAAIVAAHAAQLMRHPPTVEQLTLAKSVGRVLAQPLRADADQPLFARSARDGFACRVAEASTHRPLFVVGASRAGDAPSGPLPRGAAWEIMTGAPVPKGADAVMMVEHVELSGDPNSPAVRLLPPRTVREGENVIARGVQARKGDLLLPAGTAISAAQIALAGFCGCTTLKVFVRPRVAILATGDELVPIHTKPAPGHIRNSSSAMLAAMVAAAGGEPWVLPTARDNPKSLDAALARSASAELLLITGGVSAGKFDLVEPALARIGARFHFTGVRIQPGKPLVFGQRPAARAKPLQRLRSMQWFFGLPGNPVSSAVTFLLFAAPLLAGLSGRRDHGPRFALARLGADVERKSGLTRFLPAACTFAGPLPQVELVSWQGSGDLAAMARANCFLVLPDNVDHLNAGDTVRILLS